MLRLITMTALPPATHLQALANLRIARLANANQNVMRVQLIAAIHAQIEVGTLQAYVSKSENVAVASVAFEIAVMYGTN